MSTLLATHPFEITPYQRNAYEDNIPTIILTDTQEPLLQIPYRTLCKIAPIHILLRQALSALHHVIPHIITHTNHPDTPLTDENHQPIYFPSYRHARAHIATLNSTSHDVFTIIETDLGGHLNRIIGSFSPTLPYQPSPKLRRVSTPPFPTKLPYGTLDPTFTTDITSNGIIHNFTVTDQTTNAVLCTTLPGIASKYPALSCHLTILAEALTTARLYAVRYIPASAPHRPEWVTAKDSCIRYFRDSNSTHEFLRVWMENPGDQYQVWELDPFGTPIRPIKQRKATKRPVTHMPTLTGYNVIEDGAVINYSQARRNDPGTLEYDSIPEQWDTQQRAEFLAVLNDGIDWNFALVINEIERRTGRPA